MQVGQVGRMMCEYKSTAMISAIKCYLLSSNREIYRSVAQEYNTSAVHVYRLAHGKKSRGKTDYYILKRLREYGVIQSTLR